MKGKGHVGVVSRSATQCRKQFTVTVGTVFERAISRCTSGLQAVYLMCASKKGISSPPAPPHVGITYKSAWFMATASARP